MNKTIYASGKMLEFMNGGEKTTQRLFESADNRFENAYRYLRMNGFSILEVKMCVSVIQSLFVEEFSSFAIEEQIKMSLLDTAEEPDETLLGVSVERVTNIAQALTESQARAILAIRELVWLSDYFMGRLK